MFMRHLPIFAVALLGACASDYGRYAEEPSFQTGYGDGCVTATETDKSFSTKRQRDDEAFANDKAYASGWTARRMTAVACLERKTSEGCRPSLPDSESGRSL